MVGIIQGREKGTIPNQGDFFLCLKEIADVFQILDKVMKCRKTRKKDFFYLWCTVSKALDPFRLSRNAGNRPNFPNHAIYKKFSIECSRNDFEDRIHCWIMRAKSTLNLVLI